MQGYVGKFFVTLAVVVCQQEKIGTHCVDAGSALKNNAGQAGPVFDVVLSLPRISRSRSLINTEIL